jgi:hypothetical protein
MNSESAPQIWRFHKRSLRPQTKNPGIFKMMDIRQQWIRDQPEVESNYHRYREERENLPTTRE